MMRVSRLVIAALLLVAAAGNYAVAQERGGQGREQTGREQSGREQSGREQNSREQQGPGVLALLPPDSVTEHSIDLPTGKLAYTATAGTFALYDQSGERSAQVFYTAFVAKSANTAARP